MPIWVFVFPHSLYIDNHLFLFSLETLETQDTAKSWWMKQLSWARSAHMHTSHLWLCWRLVYCVLAWGNTVVLLQCQTAAHPFYPSTQASILGNKRARQNSGRRKIRFSGSKVPGIPRKHSCWYSVFFYNGQLLLASDPQDNWFYLHWTFSSRPIFHQDTVSRHKRWLLHTADIWSVSTTGSIISLTPYS